MARRSTGAGTVTDDDRERYTVRVGFDARMFLEDERYRIRRQRFRGTGTLDGVTYGDTLRLLFEELQCFREKCSCLDREEHDALLDLQTVSGVNGSG